MKKSNFLQFILNYSIVILFLRVEYLWFGRESSLHDISTPFVFLSLLIFLKVFLKRKKLSYSINNLSEKIRTFFSNNKLYGLLFFSILLLFIILGFMAIMYAEGGMNADEAVEGVMAMHIYKGMHRPITIYKIPYNFVFKSYLAALLFSIIGISAKTLQIIDLFFYISILILMYFLALEVFGKKAALITMFLLAIPPSSFYYICLFSTGEYVEMLSLGIIVLFLTQKYIIASRIINGETPNWFFSLIGFLWGLGFSIQALFLSFIITSAIALFLKDIKYFIKHILWRLVVFSFVGCFPLFIYNIKTNYSTIRFLMSPPRAPQNVSFIWRIKNLVNNISLASGNVNVPGLEIDGNIQLIVVSALLIMCVVSILYFLCKKWHGLNHWLFILMIVVTISLNLRPVRPGPNARYMIPLFASIPILLAWWLSILGARLKYLILILFGISNITSIAHQLLYFREVDMERIALISKLKEMGISCVGTGFWLAYPITFITKEQITCSGRYGVWSRYAQKGDPIKYWKYDPYHEKFYNARENNPQICAYVFKGSSGFEKRFIESLQTPLEKTTVGRYKIYTFGT